MKVYTFFKIISIAFKKVSVLQTKVCVFILGFAFGMPQIHPAFIQRPYGYVKLQK